MKTISFSARLQRAVHLVTLIASFAGLLLTGRPALAAEKIPAVKGETYYTQFSLFHEKNKHVTTNYRKGLLVPINTPVTFVTSSSKEIVVKMPNGDNLTIVNIEPYSGEKILGIFNRTFGKEKADLSKFSTSEKENIAGGTVEGGMSKDAVIKAIGYPPKHQTPSLEARQWRYWHSRYSTFLVHFDGGKVTEVQE